MVPKTNGYWHAFKLQKLCTVALRENYNQYPEEWSSQVESEILSKFLEARLIATKTESRATNDMRDEKPSILMLQYRPNQSQWFCKQGGQHHQRTDCVYDPETENRSSLP